MIRQKRPTPFSIDLLLSGWWWLPGLLIFGGGFYALYHDIPPWNVLWYVFGWFGYLLVLDAVIYWIRGHSFLTHRRIELLEMLFWSIPFWFLFEAYNFVLDNWYYVYALNSNWQQGIFAFLAYATVLPACFFHAEFLKAAGLFRNHSITPVNIHRGLKQFFFWFGMLCIILPLLFPRYAFWMVWGATLGVPDYLNYRNGAPSILGDLEEGRPGRLYRLLIGGLMSGFVWEGLNYWARCKWIYTVPGLEEWKLFEMPILGFLGFPVLAVEAFAFYSLLNYYLRGSRSWEVPDALQLGLHRSVWYGRAALVGVGFSLITYFGILDESLTSRRVTYQQLNPTSEGVVKNLERIDIHTPAQLFGHLSAHGIQEISERADVSAETLEELDQVLRFALHKGMGVPNAQLLREAGLQEIRDLSDADSNRLHARLQEIALNRGMEPPTIHEIRIWVRASRFAGKTRR